MRAQGPPKKHKNHLRLNKLATLGANNFLSKRDASNLSDSEHLIKSKLEYKFSALYLLPKKSYGLSQSEKISRDMRVPKGAVWSKFQVTLSRKRHGVKG